MFTVSALLVFLCLCACPTLALAQTTHRCFVGYAYHLKSGAFAYTETHHQTLEDGHPVTWHVVYRDPEGKTIAVKKMDFTANRFVPVYSLNILRGSYAEA